MIAPHTKRSCGFTLVEVMVVLLIVAVMTGLAVVGFAQVGSTDARQRQSNLLAWLNNLADGAVLDGGVYGVSISAAGLQAKVWYRDEWRELRDYDELQLPRQRFEFRPAEVKGDVSADTLPTQGETSSAVLVFLPTGMVLPAGQLVMTDSNSADVVVSLSPANKFSVVQ